ncbi:80f714f5-32db-4f09-9faa-eafeaa913976 [Thermothielavioides terrestris]|uniref:80f714f5-32db-4f09-9faa-eafeaa913976 n=1 Tax=Thermothielavioides terrestris TaxID=2587410 RepID=A0A446BR34_9PEZI|nr:80f714f5-32db-4f09-9faa-eafeaa913976 [Thermothielavioides terrestris]
MCPEDVDGGLPRQPSPLQIASYASHLRAESRTSWDGTLPNRARRSPSPSPPQSPARRSYQSRPVSAIGLAGNHSFGRPTVLADRWSYDRERMPSSPPAARSRPGTPGSERAASDRAFSRPASSHIESRPASPTPTLRVIPPGSSTDDGDAISSASSRTPFSGVSTQISIGTRIAVGFTCPIATRAKQRRTTG